jgi:hypothetical protein
MDHHPPDTRETDPWIRSLGLRPLKPRRPDAPIPRLVGDLMVPPTKAEPTMARLGRLVLTLKPSDYKLLEQALCGQLRTAPRGPCTVTWPFTGEHLERFRVPVGVHSQPRSRVLVGDPRK